MTRDRQGRIRRSFGRESTIYRIVRRQDVGIGDSRLSFPVEMFKKKTALGRVLDIELLIIQSKSIIADQDHCCVITTILKRSTIENAAEMSLRNVRLDRHFKLTAHMHIIMSVNGKTEIWKKPQRNREAV